MKIFASRNLVGGDGKRSGFFNDTYDLRGQVGHLFNKPCCPSMGQIAFIEITGRGGRRNIPQMKFCPYCGSSLDVVWGKFDYGGIDNGSFTPSPSGKREVTK